TIETLEHDDGVVHHSLVSKFPILGPGGGVQMVGGMAFDVTDRKRAEEALQREQELLQTIIDAIPVMITSYEPNTQVLRLNREFERLIGGSESEVAGTSLMEQCYPDPEYRQQVLEFMRACRSGWMDIRMRTRDGREIETSWANIRISDNTQVGIGIDITERKRVEAELREADQRKDEFLAVLAHELRNPLAPMTHALEALRLRHGDNPDVERARQVLERQVHQMSRLVDDLLDVSRITRGAIELRPEWVDLTAVARAAEEAARPTIKAREM